MQFFIAYPTGVQEVGGGAFLYRRCYATPAYYYVHPSTQVKDPHRGLCYIIGRSLRAKPKKACMCTCSYIKYHARAL